MGYQFYQLNINGSEVFQVNSPFRHIKNGTLISRLFITILYLVL